ncbi:hypothetical protein [Sphingomonas sp.]|uniref:hypothetical protein n=1 Tax=Sphingomonas sp. TaxID=28214 RepID=UPI002BDBDD54|nr:hypothetical protein [Sphingomonas sp.]HTG38244.1 hypothetical protein [Sphingomonas sp.]
MNGGSRIIDFHADRAPRDAAPGEDDILPLERTAMSAAFEPPPGRGADRWISAVAAIAAMLWIAAAGWLLWADPRAAAMRPADILQTAAAILAPIALVGLLWLVARRTGDAQARRFTALQRAMREEADQFEARMLMLSERIAADRALLDEHMRELMETGDSATARMQAVSNAMTTEVASIHAAARTLGESSEGAARRLAILLAQLPKARDEVQALAASFGDIGMDAGERVSALDAQLAALAERGRHADEVAGGAAQRLAAHITRMEATSESAGARLEEVTAHMTQEVDAVLERAATAIDEARRGIAAQGDATAAMIATNQAALDQHTQTGLDRLRERLAMVEASIGSIADALDREREQADSLFESLDANVARANAQIDLLHEAGTKRALALAEQVATVTIGLDAMRDAMTGGDEVARTTMATAEMLLTALDAATREIDETLPDALARLDSRVGDSRRIVSAAKPELLALVTAAESTHSAIEAINVTVNTQRDTLVALSAALVDALGTGSSRIEDIQATIERTIADTRDFADDAAPRLVDALVRIRETAGAAADHARKTLGAVIPDAAARLEHAAVEHFARAFDDAVARQLNLLAEAADDAVRIATQAADRVGQKTLAIAEASAQVEARIEQADAAREAADRDSFARRVSLLIEALNSASIDIAKALSADVADTAWAAYLKGDRGVFTRRAVRLLEPGQLREIAALYDADPGFHEQVNRYIHDFEAMLRMVLAQRDGSPMGVTLLSSDSGKLYVALAQAIERLRT